MAALLVSAEQYNALLDQVRSLSARVGALEGGTRPAAVARILTVGEAAKRLNVSTKTVYRRIREGKIRAVLISAKSYGIDEDEIIQYLSR